MTGLVGFTREVAGHHDPTPLLRSMQSMLASFPHLRKDRLWSDRWVSATRVYNDYEPDSGQSLSQPSIHGEGTLIWMDGVFNNRREVAAQYRVADPNSDIALLGTLYGVTGNLDFLGQIDGFYAAVIYDRGRRQIHLFTDRLGIRRFHWAVHQRGLWWSSEVKAGLALPDYQVRIDRQTALDFTHVGNPFGDRTWFEDVKRMEVGTALTWDLTQGSISRNRYWWWDSIRLRSGPLQPEALADELAQRFVEAVTRRSHGPRVNADLSGGLDSRAIVAAIPADREVHTYTSGQQGAEDIRLARLVSAVRGARHHVFVVDSRNWLDETVLSDIWRMDGEAAVPQVVGSRTHGPFLAEAPLRLNGTGANLLMAGSRLSEKTLDTPINHAIFASLYDYSDFDVDLSRYANLAKIDFAAHEIRSRRYLGGAIHTARTHGELYLPWYDNAVVEFIYSLPDRLRYQYRLYHLMLLRRFPAYFERIPWKSTGIPIGTPSPGEQVRRLPRKVQRVFFQYMRRLGWTEYKHNNPRYLLLDTPRWIREEPSRSFFENVLLNPAAIYPEYIDRDRVIKDFERHLKGENFAQRLLYCLSAEIWFQQLFEGKYGANR